MLYMHCSDAVLGGEAKRRFDWYHDCMRGRQACRAEALACYDSLHWVSKLDAATVAQHSASFSKYIRLRYKQRVAFGSSHDAARINTRDAHLVAPPRCLSRPHAVPLSAHRPPGATPPFRRSFARFGTTTHLIISLSILDPCKLYPRRAGLNPD